MLGVVAPVCTQPNSFDQNDYNIRGRLTFKKGFSIQIYISDLAKIILHAIVSNIELRLHLGGLIAKHSLSCATLYASFVLSNLLRIL